MALSGNALAGEKILRVGVAWQDGIFMRNADGSYSGYMVEYFAKLAQYAGWKYEFVPSDPISSSIMLQKGEVDLGSYILKTPQREKLYDFPVQSSGVLPLSVIARADNEELKNNSPFRWSNLKVAFWGKSEPTKVSFAFFARNNAITYTSIDFARYEDAIAAVESGRADVFVHRVVELPPELCVVRQFDYKPFFTVCGKNNPKLLRELEEATQALKVNEPAFLDGLTRKYVKTVKLTDRSRKRIRIGFYQEDGYYGFNQFGTRFGYNVDYMNRIAKINNWDIDYVDVSFADALKLLDQGKIDVVCSLGKSPEREKNMLFPVCPVDFIPPPCWLRRNGGLDGLKK